MRAPIFTSFASSSLFRSVLIVAVQCWAALPLFTGRGWAVTYLHQPLAAALGTALMVAAYGALWSEVREWPTRGRWQIALCVSWLTTGMVLWWMVPDTEWRMYCVAGVLGWPDGELVRCRACLERCRTETRRLIATEIMAVEAVEKAWRDTGQIVGESATTIRNFVPLVDTFTDWLKSLRGGNRD